ncbi:hypothetical protein [Nocardiopsis sp. MG754419]|uniref:hypothetical protein n=1 Tax=Nocardiopsis sp. MG754419 TaxID=2259865 RepID=UPI001BAA91C6|nr:hypothetical protein [Nocardiopsis sp. MG754419]MBR8742690.1 hypothetical protein [Nocardiopsis sp. MG754419]
MRHDDLFVVEGDDHSWNRRRLDHQRIDSIRRGTASGVDDDDAAITLMYLLIDDLPESHHDEGLLDNADTGTVIRCLRTVLRRLGIDDGGILFFDKNGYTDLRSAEQAPHTGGASAVFAPIQRALDRRDRIQGGGGIRGLRGDLRNLIFAARREPEIVWHTHAGGTIEITRNKEHCLLYDLPVDASGLTWEQVMQWWKLRDGNYEIPTRALRKNLRDRLREGITETEDVLFRAYWEFCTTRNFHELPALLPHVYLHYDPLIRNQRIRRTEGKQLERPRMDFLLLAPGGRRYVLELDGRHHYAHDGVASDDLYAQIVREDRELRLRGYEVYRFGGTEFLDEKAAGAMLHEFFAELLSR